MLRRNCFSALLLLIISSVCGSSSAQKTAEIPPGISIKVRMIDRLDSGKSQAGDTFHGTLEQPIVVDGKDIYPKGADVTGRVEEVKQSGRLSEPGELGLVVATIASGNRASSVQSERLAIKGESHAKSNAGKIGGGAALGALIGAVAGGGKGAAIGAGVGGAAGTGAAAATGKREAVVESEAVLTFVTAQASTVNSGASANPTPPPPPPPAAGENQPRADDTAPAAPRQQEAANDQPESESNNATNLFTARDRRVIRNCVAEHTSDLPPGITEREELPPGNERQIRAGGTLPPELQKKVQALPLVCEKELPELPGDLERVLYSGRVLLINDQSNRIVDLFYLDETR
jgi:hypothetical protein